MDQQVETLKTELGKVARKVHVIYENATFEEKANAKRQLDRLQTEIEKIFKRYLGVVPRSVISSVTDQTRVLINKEIESFRLAERNENITQRLGGCAKATSALEMSKKVKEFELGGVYEAKGFDAKVDEIVARVVAAYQKVLANQPLKNSDMALDNIRGRCRNTFNRIEETHGVTSKEIKRKVISELQQLGLDMSLVSQKQTQVDTGAKSNSFQEGLANATISNKEVIVNYAKAISDAVSRNMEAFHERPSTVKSTKIEEYRDMFK